MEQERVCIKAYQEFRTYMLYTADTLRLIAKGAGEYPSKTLYQVLRPEKMDNRSAEQIVVDTLLRVKEGVE